MKVLPIPALSNIEKYWFDNNPSLTHFMSALSVLFPEGERYFMKTMNAYRNELSDETLNELNTFCRQEANHGRMHTMMNNRLESLIDSNTLNHLEHRTKRILELPSKLLNKKQQLAVTICLEHITGVMGDQLLRRDDITSMMESDMKIGWMYHGTEELDHCDVSFNIYEEIGGGANLRRVIMIPVTIGLILVTIDNWIKIMSADKNGYKGLIKSLRTIIGRKGFITGMIPEYMKWFKEDYHPMTLKNDNYNYMLSNK